MTKSSYPRHLFLVVNLICILCFLFCSATARAQFRAGIEGTVVDASGAAVAGVTVTVMNQETGKSEQVTTGEGGFYRVSGLAPGKYRLTTSFTGFKQKVVKDITINAEEVQGVNVTIEPGAVNESVTVTGETVPQLQTENGSVTGDITNQQIHALPQIGRDPYELLRLAPGVFGDGARSGDGNSVALPNSTGPGGSNDSVFQTENQVPISGAGQRPSSNNFAIDGVSVNSLGWGGAAVVTPNQESVKEIRVTTNAYDAQYGRNSGAHIEVVSQNGTNQFHGSGFFKYDEPNLNAFNKYGGPGVARPKRVEKKLRNFGGSVGGPVLKDKLFFFFSYEGLRTRNTTFSTPIYVETPQYRQSVVGARPGGITAKILSSPGIEPRIVQVIPGPCPSGFKPNTCREVAGGLDIGSPYGSLGQYLNKDSTAVGGGIVGGGLDGIPDIMQVILAQPGQTRGNQFNGRMDFNRGANDSFAVSMFFTRFDRLSSDNGGRSRPMGDTRFKPFNSAVTLTYNRILSPATLNEARVNFTRFSANQLADSPDTNWGIPRVEVESLPFDRIRFGPNRSDTTPALFAQNTIEFRDTLHQVFRTHALKFGVEIRKEQDNNKLLGGARPLYSFRGLWNLANDAPVTENINADPNTGLPADAQRYFRTGDYGLFAQDDWKLQPNLTLNLGLRWEYYSPLTEQRGHLSNLVFGPNGLRDATVVVVDELFSPTHTNFAPRLGFAYSPISLFKNKLVVRGGFGIFYNRIPDVLFTNTRGNPPFFAKYTPCCLPEDRSRVGSQIVYTLGASNSPDSYPVNPNLASSIDPATGAPRGRTVEVWGAPSNMKNAYVYEYSLGLEYSLPHNFVAALGYEGSAGRKLIRIVNQNFLYPPTPRSDDPKQNAFSAVFFPLPDTNSNFNALNARLSHRFAKGFQAEGRYRYSKSIDQLSYEGPGGSTNQTYPQDVRTERGPSDYDATHHFNLSGLWDLPIFSHRKDLVGTILGGWQVSGILTAHSGFPWTPVTGQSISTPDGKTLAPTRPIAQTGTPLTDHSNDAFMRPGGNFPGGGLLYFDIGSKGPPSLRAPGIGRNSFRGPHYFSTDLSLAKAIPLSRRMRLGEAARLDLRANFFNAFNQLNLSPFTFDSNSTKIENQFFGQAGSGLAGRVIEFQARLSF